MKPNMIVVVVLIAALAVFIVLSAGGLFEPKGGFDIIPDENDIVFDNGYVLRDAAGTKIDSSTVDPSDVIDGKVYAHMEVTSRTPEDLQWLSDHGIQAQWTSTTTAYVGIPTDQIDDLDSAPFVETVVEVPYEAKFLSQDLLNEAVANPDNKFNITINALDNVDRTVIKRELSKHGVIISEAPVSNDFTIETTGRGVIEIARIPFIERIRLELFEPRPSA